MNAKQLEEMVRNQGAAIEGMVKAMEDVTGRMMGLSNGLVQVNAMVDKLAGYMGHPADLDEGEPFYAELKAMKEKVAEMAGDLAGVKEKVEATNKSAPTKRNMTDDDAMEVMNGKWAELEHKDAAEKAGLTYAQVYSCRLEYTFKHVHKALKDAGFKNKWAKK